jgi:hypothetical protein
MLDKKKLAYGMIIGFKEGEGDQNTVSGDGCRIDRHRT